MWNIHGQIESLKGTFLHKQIELFLQALVRPVVDGRVPYDGACVRALLPYVMEQVASFSPLAVMRHIAWLYDDPIWDHPSTQQWLRERLRTGHVEFDSFLHWLGAHDLWMPFRVEWSVFTEDYHVAGQIDSVWLDECKSFVMVDWKRVRHILTSDTDVQRIQSFDRMARISPSDVGTPAVSNPCLGMYDCAFNHYLVQQACYATILQQKYDIVLSSALLVQMHSQLCPSLRLPYHEESLNFDRTFAESLFAALSLGWCLIDRSPKPWDGALPHGLCTDSVVSSCGVPGGR